ncbi:MAG: helix-turn-helix domain-containing protein [Beijerinckiaceae bacterium]
MAHRMGNRVSRFGLYGESEGAGDAEFFHIEDIQSRSRLYKWRIAAHTHARMFQIVWLSQGPARVEADGDVQNLEGPCAICVPGGVVHSFVFDAHSSGHVVTVAESLLLETPGRDGSARFERFSAGPHVIRFKPGSVESSRIGALMDRMASEFHETLPFRSDMFQWQLQAALVLLLRAADTANLPGGKAGFRRDIYVRFERMLEDRFREQWTAAQYAQALAIGAARLNRFCREFSGKTAVELAHDRTILEARRMLVYTSAPVEAIAFELGFKDPGYFNRFFKRRTGTTPGAFRRVREASSP